MTRFQSINALVSKDRITKEESVANSNKHKTLEELKIGWKNLSYKPYRDMLEGLQSLIGKVEKFRNIIAHNGIPIDDDIAGFIMAKEEIEKHIIDFWEAEGSINTRISSLYSSTSPSDTLTAVADLVGIISSFSAEQVHRIIAAAKNNAQVGSIFTDKDVKDFYNTLMEIHSNNIPTEDKQEMFELLTKD